MVYTTDEIGAVSFAPHAVAQLPSSNTPEMAIAVGYALQMLSKS